MRLLLRRRVVTQTSLLLRLCYPNMMSAVYKRRPVHYKKRKSICHRCRRLDCPPLYQKQALLENVECLRTSFCFPHISHTFSLASTRPGQLRQLPFCSSKRRMTIDDGLHALSRTCSLDWPRPDHITQPSSTSYISDIGVELEM